MPELQLIAELLALGVVAGFLAGLLGIGGGMMMVPFITLILTSKGYPHDYVLKMAVATSLATICFTSASSVRAHHQRGAVRWDIVKAMAPGIVIGSILGAQIAAALPGRVLTVFFAVFLTFTATQMLINRKPKAARGLPGAWGMFGVGSLIGVMASLVGAGGAFIAVPFMTWCNVKIHDAVGTSSAIGFPVALAGTVGYVIAGLHGMPEMPPGSFGYLYLPALLIISVASVALAPLGARTAHRMNIAPLKRVFAVVLYAMAAYFLFRGK